MGYYIDLSKITLDEYKLLLENGYLPPSRMILKKKLDRRFKYFKSIGINNVLELQQTLKKKDKLSAISKIDDFSEDYLKMLLREINSLLPKPNKLSDFPNISPEIITRLESYGIKNTVKLYDKVRTVQNRKELSNATGIGDKEILELTKLTDLSRIKWVSGIFSRVLYDLGYDTAKKVSKAKPEKLHLEINQLNKKRSYYKGHIGLNDVRILVDVAKDVPIEIEYQ